MKDEILMSLNKNKSIRFLIVEQNSCGAKTPLEGIDFDLHRFKKYGLIYLH